MSRYKVIIEDSAQADVQDSYDWGCRVWGSGASAKVGTRPPHSDNQAPFHNANSLPACAREQRI